MSTRVPDLFWVGTITHNDFNKNYIYFFFNSFVLLHLTKALQQRMLIQLENVQRYFIVSI